MGPCSISILSPTKARVDLKNKRIVFHYGVAPKDMPAGFPILAHERDAATNGGLVLFWDGSVMAVTAKGVSKYPIAKAKK